MSHDSERYPSELAHILFMDIVGYSLLLINDQRRVVALLQTLVRNAPEFQQAQTEGRVISSDTGDGLALVFFGDPTSPVYCAVEIALALREKPELQLRMGINSGLVSRTPDFNGHDKVTGSGINMAQRVMDCGNAGHILLSQTCADILRQFSEWATALHDLGEYQIKHDDTLRLYNLCTEEVGNPVPPSAVPKDPVPTSSTPSATPQSAPPRSPAPTGPSAQTAPSSHKSKPAPSEPPAMTKTAPPRSSAPTTPQQQPTSGSQPATTTRRNFLWGMGAIGAAACGLYAFNSYQQDKDKKEKEARKGGAKAANANAQGNSNQSGTSGGANTNANIESGTQPRTKINPTDGAEMAWIPAGTFRMGSEKGEDEKPIHPVSLSGFWMYTTPVTVAQFRKYDAANGSKYDWAKHKPSWGWLDDHPMVNVSLDDASAYAQWAGVALPTEAQWEYAARGHLEGKNYPWGDDWDGSKCANSVKPYDLKGTKAVKSYPANGCGLYDMAGNVWQWCAVWYDKDYYKTAAASQTDPKGRVRARSTSCGAVLGTTIPRPTSAARTATTSIPSAGTSLAVSGFVAVLQ